MDFKKIGLMFFVTLVLLTSMAFATAGTVGATTISGYTHIGSNYYGTGTIVGGTATAGTNDLNTSSCQYTIDGTTWLPASWSTNHCQKTSYTINGGQNYILNTRIDDNTGAHVTGTSLTVQGAMLPTDIPTSVFDMVGQFLAGIVSNATTLVIVIVLVLIIGLVVDMITGVFGVVELVKKALNL